MLAVAKYRLYFVPVLICMLFYAHQPSEYTTETQN
jgi:hypothetical protein